jgi:calcium/calmodulin-dependent protein kinase I
MDWKLPDARVTQVWRFVLNPLANYRHHFSRLPRAEEEWKRQRELGNGMYGRIWLERCLAGARQGELRAVKEIVKNRSKAAPVDYAREQEAIAKFLNCRVCNLLRRYSPNLTQIQYKFCFVQSDGWYESRSSVFISMEYLEHADLQKYITHPFPEEEAEK